MVQKIRNLLTDSIPATPSISYSILMVIAASACLGISLLLVLLYRYGFHLRHFAFIRIAKREQMIWKRQRRESGSIENSASRSGSRRNSPFNNHQVNQNHNGIGSRFRQLILPKGVSFMSLENHPKVTTQLTVSQPFNFLHVSTGHSTVSTPVSSNHFPPHNIKPRVVTSGGYTIVVVKLFSFANSFDCRCRASFEASDDDNLSPAGQIVRAKELRRKIEPKIARIAPPASY